MSQQFESRKICEMKPFNLHIIAQQVFFYHFKHKKFYNLIRF